jgi:uncharacterized protein YjdB
MLKRQRFASLAWCAAFFAVLLLSACGGSSSSTVTTLSVTPTVSSVAIGGHQTFTANARNKDGNVVSGSALTWTSSVTSVATIESTGTATGVSAGTTQITAQVQNSTVTSTPVTLVVLPQISSVTVTPSSASIEAGATEQFSAVAKDVNGNTVSSAIFTWAIGNSKIATINNTGLATGVSAGTVTVTASTGGVTSPAVTLTVTN